MPEPIGQRYGHSSRGMSPMSGMNANTSTVSARARVRARVGGENQRPWPADKVERWAIDRLIPYAKNARTHTDAQVAAIAASIKEWGWTSPNVSLAELLASLPPEQLATFLKRTSDRELEAIEHDWGWWGRCNQQAPKGDWRTWLLRGWGQAPPCLAEGHQQALLFISLCSLWYRRVS